MDSLLQDASVDSGHARVPIWAVAWSFWTLLAISYAASSVISAINEGEPASWSRSLSWYVLDFYLWMGLTPLVARLGRCGARDWRRFWAVHVPSSVLVAALQSVVMLLLYWWWRGPGPKSTITSLAGFLHIESVYKFHLGLLTYWLLLVVLRGLASQRSLKGERLRNARLEGQLAQSQLQALRMQLQPHFLFNTLNAISALALADPPQARLMIARLSDFLRLTLEESHAQHLPLSREMQFLECYLGIQQVRFQDRLATHLDLAADTLGAAVPSLILQPLVENALRHGLLAKPGRGNLSVSSRRENDRLVLRVDDDGLGLPHASVREGIGLANTRARLQALFGDDATLELQPVTTGGTGVEVRFPFVAWTA